MHKSIRRCLLKDDFTESVLQVTEHTEMKGVFLWGKTILDNWYLD